MCCYFVARDRTMQHGKQRLLADDLLAQMRVCMCNVFGFGELRYLSWNQITAIPVDAFASLTSLNRL